MSENIYLENISVLLEKIIQEIGFNDFSVHISPGSKPGDGFNSDLLSITIADNISDMKLNIVCKRCIDLNSSIFFKREVLFYNELMPLLIKFQDEKNLEKKYQFSSYSICYGATADDDRKHYVVIMEDIRVKGFEMRNRAEITPIENIRLVMSELGKFHGLSIAMKDQRPEQLKIFERASDIYGIVCDQLMHTTFYKHFDCSIKSLKNPNHQNIMRDIKNHYSSYVNNCINSKTSDKFLVLSHGKHHFVVILF